NGAPASLGRGDRDLLRSGRDAGWNAPTPLRGYQPVSPVAVLGRVCADLYPLEPETPLSEVRRFERFVGGFAGNVSTALARLGFDCAIVSAVGDDGHGVFVRRFLTDQGVDCSRLGVHPRLSTALAFCELWPPDRFPITFYRWPTCPDWELELDAAACARLA